MHCLKKLTYGVATLLLTGCGSHLHNYDPNPTQLQIRESQSRTFEESDSKSVMKAMINVLQDEGYIVKNAVLELGFLTAEKSVEVEDSDNGMILISMFKGGKSDQSKHAILEVSANVSDFGEETTKVRLNFQKKTFDTKGCLTAVDHIMDEIQYQSFFAKVSKAIFFESENL